MFFTALVLILLANLYVLKAPPTRLTWHYAGLLGLLAAAIAIPIDLFLSGGIFWRYAVPCALALGLPRPQSPHRGCRAHPLLGFRLAVRPSVVRSTAGLRTAPY